MEILAQFDRRLVQPSFAALLETLNEATCEIDRPRKVLKRTSEDWAELIRQIRSDREGHRVWQEAFTYRHVWLFIAWWTDPLQRRHFRVSGLHVNNAGGHRPTFLEHSPPISLTYPERVLLRAWSVSAFHEVLLCGCGDSQPADNPIGWMGPCCVACYDRAQEGIASPTIGQIRDLGEAETLAEHPNGSLLLLRPGGVLEWDDGQRPDWPKDVRQFTFDTLGERLFLRHGAYLQIRDLIHDRVLRELYLGEQWHFAAAPDGNEVAIFAEDGMRLLGEQTDGSWNWTRELPNARTIAWSPTGEATAMLLNDCLRIERPNTQEMVLRPELEEAIQGHPTTSRAKPSLAFTSNGQTLRLLPSREGGHVLITARWDGREWLLTDPPRPIDGPALLSENGQFLHSGEGNLWELDTERMIGRFRFPPWAEICTPRLLGYSLPDWEAITFLLQDRYLAIRKNGRLRLVPWAVLFGVDLPVA